MMQFNTEHTYSSFPVPSPPSPLPINLLRCVSDEIRSLALGLQSMLFRLFGNIPSPLIYGALFDTSCLYWQDQCGSRGNCWVYDNNLLSYRLLSLPLAGMVLTSLCTLLAWRLYPSPLTIAARSDTTTASPTHIEKSPDTNGMGETEFGLSQSPSPSSEPGQEGENHKSSISGH